MKHDANVLSNAYYVAVEDCVHVIRRARQHHTLNKIDGGECAKALFAILCLLVASRCYGRIVVTRLPVGHSKS